MDLEFMLLDTLDKVRPAATFKKQTSLADIEKACSLVEQFEQDNMQTGLVEVAFDESKAADEEERQILANAVQHG